MLRAVVKKEMLGHLVSFRFFVGTLIMLVLATHAAIAGTDDYRLRQRSYETHLEQHREDLRQVHVYSQLHPVVARAPESLSVLDRGFDARLGTEVELDVFSVPVAASGNPRTAALVSSVRALDLSTIVRVVLGLLALLLTFDAISGERERRTLRLILANSVARSTVLAGKFIGAFLTLLVPLALSLLLSLWILLERGGVTLGLDRWQRLAGLFASYVAYLCVMLLLGLVLSTAARTASASLVYSLLTWLLLVFLIPQSAVAVASAAARTDGSRSSTEKAVSEVETERNRRLLEIERRYGLRTTPPLERASFVEMTPTRGVLYRYGSAVYYAARAQYHPEETALGMDYAERIFEIRRGRQRDQRRFERLVRVLSFPSPAFLLDRLSESLAGTSSDDHDAFLEDCRVYRETFIEYLRRRRAFSSWRWFTDDDSAALRPWPTLTGVAPDAVAAADVRQLILRLQSVEIQSRVWQEKEEYDHDPARLLDLDDLPAPTRSALGLMAAGKRVKLEIAALMLANGLLAGAALWRFRDDRLK